MAVHSYLAPGSGAVAGATQLTAEAAEFYQRTLLDRLMPKLMIAKYGEKSYQLPKKSGDTTSWRRFRPLALPANMLNTAGTALQARVAGGVTPSGLVLVEGQTPSPIQGAVDKYSITVKQYGTFMEFTDYVDMVGLDPVVTEFTELLGDHAGLAIDTYIRDILLATTNVAYTNARASRVTVAATDRIAAIDILKIRRWFKRNFVEPITCPNGKKAYLCFVHPDVATDLMTLTEWKDQNTYISNENRIEGTIGQMYGVYFVEYDNATVLVGAGAASANVYQCLCIGSKAFGITDIGGSMKPEIIVKGLGSSGTADPLNQRSTVGWKNLMAACILNTEAVYRLETSATI